MATSVSPRRQHAKKFGADLRSLLIVAGGIARRPRRQGRDRRTAADAPAVVGLQADGDRHARPSRRSRTTCRASTSRPTARRSPRCAAGPLVMGSQEIQLAVRKDAVSNTVAAVNGAVRRVQHVRQRELVLGAEGRLAAARRRAHAPRGLPARAADVQVRADRRQRRRADAAARQERPRRARSSSAAPTCSRISARRRCDLPGDADEDQPRLAARGRDDREAHRPVHLLVDPRERRQHADARGEPDQPRRQGLDPGGRSG